jgi:WD40 repeat protein
LSALIEPQEPSSSDSANDKTERTKVINWETSTDSITEVPVDSKDVVTSIALGPNGTLALATTDDQNNFKIVVWSQNRQTALPCQGACRAKALSLAFSHTTGVLAAGLEDGKVVLWNVASSTRITDDAIGSGIPVTALAFNPNDTLLAAATNEKGGGSYNSRPGAITLLDVAMQSPAGSLLIGHRGRVSDIAFSPDGKTLASASSDSESVSYDGDYKIILWDLNLDNVDSQFCDIAGCATERPIVSANIKKSSWFQRFYSRISKWLGEGAAGT